MTDNNKNNKIITLSIVKNEEKNFLKDWLINTSQICDLHIIVDNGSTDNTKEIIKEFPNVILFESDIDFKTNEHKLRGFAYDCLKDYAKNNDWIIILDADQFVYYEDFIKKKETLLNLPEKYNFINFKLCEIWDKKSLWYRTDGNWSPFFNRAFRYEENQLFTNKYKEGLHISPIPDYILKEGDRGVFPSDIRILHYAYCDEQMRKDKYDFYMKNVSPKDVFNYNHAKSILEIPTLVPLENNDNQKKIICSLIRNREWILPFFLDNFKPILKDSSYEYYFIVNNCLDDSEKILREWVLKNNLKCTIETYNFEDEMTGNHNWGDTQLMYMAKMRNKHLQFARNNKADYMFSIDSDLLFNANIFEHLIISDKDIISPVFFASWNKDKINAKRLPQVWERGGYEVGIGFIQNLLFSKYLRKVGGLGAFTCISKNAFNNEALSYDRVDNLPTNMRGEDRDFCVRARVLNYELWASNYYDLLHVDNINMLNLMIQSKQLLK